VNTALALTLWALSFLFATSEESQIKLSYPQIDVIDAVRARFLLSLHGQNSDAVGLVAGLTIGERTLLSDEVESQMRTLSLTHLVAVSGANLAIVVGATYFLLAGLGLARNLRFLIAFTVMALYVVLVGPESSVIRAATMAIFVMVGLWLGRGSTPLNSLSLAVIVLLVIDPALSRDIGFALSAFATAGLLIFAPPVFEWLRERVPDFVALGLAASFAAQLFTTPILLMIQPSIPIYSVLANLLVEPVVAPITILGILGVIVSIVSIPLAGAFTFVASWFANWIVIVAHELSSWPLARVHFVQGLAGIAIVAAVVALLALSFGALHRRARELQVVAGTLVVLAFGWASTDVIRRETFAGDYSLYNCDVGQGDALIVRDSGVVALIDVGPDSELVDRCLDSAGVTRIDLLVLTHFDADHVRGIDGALRGRKVGLAIVSGFEDDRPLVAVVESALQRADVPVALGRAGLSGQLGTLSWKVLQPSALATEALDSNDASVVVAFWNQSNAVLALGDLGESGQQRLLRNAMGDLAQLRSRNLTVKVAHHGSSDQSDQLARYLEPETAIFSVGKNDYGHPTRRALELYGDLGAAVLRTDLHGPVAIRFDDEGAIVLGGKLST
jgi:competence protein ComEC